MHAPQSNACQYIILIFENINKMYCGEIMTLWFINLVVRDGCVLMIKYTDGLWMLFIEDRVRCQAITNIFKKFRIPGP